MFVAKLSERLRPDVECAPWVTEAVREMEASAHELLDALKLARNELSDLNSAYGAENVDEIIDRCDTAITHAHAAGVK